jgi:DNA sulfur modification protein DndD
MKIKELKLFNFKSYEGEVVFNLQTTNEKKVILIGGKNGAGKSSFFDALKICIYGPAAYKYESINTIYINKIKSFINHKSFTTDNAKAFVEVVLTIEEELELNEYVLKREWNFEQRKLIESFYVKRDGIELDDSSKQVFSNYIQSKIPSKLFEFFFFDGESLASFFLGKDSNAFLKDSFLALSNLDTFEILAHFLNLKQNSLKGLSKEEEDISNKFTELNNDFSEAIKRRDELEEQIVNLSTENENNKLEKENNEYHFRISGGILNDEKERITAEINSKELVRQELNTQIKDYCNEVLPFYILNPQLKDLSIQLKKEEDFQIKNALKDRLDNLNFEDLFDGLTSEISFNPSQNEKLRERLLGKIIDRSARNVTVLHGLSNDSKGIVENQISTIINYTEDPKTYFNELKNIGSDILTLRDKLKLSQNEEYINSYLAKQMELTTQIERNENDRTNLINEKNVLLERINQLTKEIQNVKDQRYSLLQSNSIVKITEDIKALIDSLITELLQEKIIEIKKYFMEIFGSLIRKDRYIDSIDIDANFNISLYSNRFYTSDEILSMLSNIGFDEIQSKYGQRFIEDLFSSYKCSNKSLLMTQLKENNITSKLRTKVDLNELSNGEKQIYILCLYWALVKTSNVDIPFIIDTPYSRIDEIHRYNINNVFLPNISSQVIILSTDTEVNEESYQQLKKYLSNEYLLNYQDQYRKTYVENRYFFEVN